MNIGNVLSSSAFQVPQKTAVIFGKERISYGKLDRETTALAKWLLEEGSKPGDRVAILWPNSLETVELLLACFKAGLIAVPIHASMKGPEIAYVLDHSKAVTCLVHPNLTPATLEATQGCNSLRSLHSDLEPAYERNWGPDLPSIGDEDPALILYTSGTTARPKGVTHTHSTILEMIKITSAVAPTVETALLVTQLSYSIAICVCLLPAIANGATTIVAPGFDAPLVLDFIERFHCDFMIGLPSMLQFLVEEQIAKPRHVRSLRTVLAGGDSVSPATQQRFQSLFGIPVREIYGMTETGPLAVNPAAEVRPGSLGQAVAGVELRIVDNQGREVPDGQTGQIIARSPGCFVGYWDDPQATAEAIRDGWLYTGDLGHRNEEGYVWFDGREKEIIVRGGYNISPQEVEEVIYAHPSVREVAVVGQPAPVYGERVVAYVSLRDGRTADEEELREFARARLADHKVPEKFIFLAALPKGVTGKIRRRALKEMPATAVA